jgi:hypothetical protein
MIGVRPFTAGRDRPGYGYILMNQEERTRRSLVQELNLHTITSSDVDRTTSQGTHDDQ